MAILVARVHLKVAHTALPALLPTPPMWKKLPLLPTPCAAIVKPSRDDSDERWDAHKKSKPGSSSSAESSASSSRRFTVSIKNGAGRGSCRCKNAPSPPPKSGRADSAQRWDVHKIKRCPAQAELLDDGESSSTGSNDVDTEMEEEEKIVWKPQAVYAGPGFAAVVPKAGMLPMPTVFLVPAA